MSMGTNYEPALTRLREILDGRYSFDVALGMLTHVEINPSVLARLPLPLHS